MKHFFIVLIILALTFSCSEKRNNTMPENDGSKSEITSIPHLEKQGEATHLMVKNKPFLILGGELHNSSSSNLDYLKSVMPQLATAGLNTVLAVVSWDLFEPEEGIYDYKLMDGLIQEARENDMQLIVLWFGSWKNGLSHYCLLYTSPSPRD